MAKLCAICPLQDQRDQLRKLLKQGDAAIENYLEPRHVIDLFLEYPSAKPKLFKVRISYSALPHPHDST